MNQRQSEDGPVDVCVITTIHPPYNARVYLRELMALVDRGYRVALVSPWDRTERADPRVRWVQLKNPAKRIHRVLHGWRTFRAAWKVKARAYHFHDLDFLPWSLLLKFVKGVPVVYDCHENYPEEIRYSKVYIPKALRPPLAFCVRVFENFCVWALGEVIVPVKSLEERFARYGARIQLVRNLARWEARRDLVHEQALIFTGGLSPTYGMYGLLDISRELKRRNRKCKLIVVDRFYTEELKRHFLGVIAQEGLDIDVRSKVTPDDMDALLAKAWIGLATELDTPDRRLSLPTKLFEYMAMGLPVVASGIPLSKEVVESAGCGLVVPPGDWKAFADAVENLWDDAALMQRFQEKGFAAIEGEFSWDHEQKKLISFFEGILGEPTH